MGNNKSCDCKKALPYEDCGDCRLKRYEKEYPDDIIGGDGMYDKSRRKNFIDECKKINTNIICNIGRNVDGEIDRPQTLNLMVQIPNRENVISCIFSHHALCCLIETMTFVSKEECEFLTSNELPYVFNNDNSNIQQWNSVGEIINFVSLLCQMYN